MTILQCLNFVCLPLKFKDMRYKLSIFFILFSVQAMACKCSWRSIAENYQSASLIFYGKHIGKANNTGVYATDGRQLQFDNFEIIRFYKGLSSASIGLNQKISLVSNSQSSCGFTFDSSRYYLVYAHAQNAGNYWEVSQCSRTKEIRNNQFIVPTQPDPEAGKDEQRELIRLAQAAGNSTHLDVWEKDMSQLKMQHEESQISLQKQLKKKNSMSIILSTTTLILLIYVLLDFWKKKAK